MDIGHGDTDTNQAPVAMESPNIQLEAHSYAIWYDSTYAQSLLFKPSRILLLQTWNCGLNGQKCTELQTREKPTN